MNFVKPSLKNNKNKKMKSVSWVFYLKIGTIISLPQNLNFTTICGCEVNVNKWRK